MPKTKLIPSEKPLDAPGGTPVEYVRENQENVIEKRGLGMKEYSDKSLGEYIAQPIGKKGELSRHKWSEIAYILALRAKRASQSYSKKDFNALYRLILSAGIAFDKAFPQQVQPLSGNLVVQLFGSLGSQVSKAILEPAHPIIDVTPNQDTLGISTPVPQTPVGSNDDIVGDNN